MYKSFIVIFLGILGFINILIDTKYSLFISGFLSGIILVYILDFIKES